MNNKKLPAQLEAWLKKYPNLKATAQGRGDEVISYDLVCTKCGEKLWVTTTCTESAAFEFYDGEFENRKFQMDDSEVDLHCNCEDHYYERPEEYEVNW